MKIGVFTQGFVRPGDSINTRIHQVVEQAVATEEAGLDHFGTAEQHFNMPTNSCGAIDVILGAVAVRTKRIRILPGAVVLPFYHPMMVAERWATIDTLSNGRLDFAVGRGNSQWQFDLFGVKLEGADERMREALELIGKAWTHDRVSFEGTHYQVPDVPMVPRPMQTPHPPFYGAATSESTAKLIGSWKIGLLTIGRALTWPEVEDRLSAYREAWKEAPPIPHVTPNNDIHIHILGHLSDSLSLTRAQVEEPLLTYTGRVINKRKGAINPTTSTVDFDNNFDAHLRHSPVAFGSPEECIQTFIRLKEMGVDAVSVMHDYATHEQILRSIHLLGTKVKPIVDAVEVDRRRIA